MLSNSLPESIRALGYMADGQDQGRRAIYEGPSPEAGADRPENGGRVCDFISKMWSLQSRLVSSRARNDVS